MTRPSPVGRRSQQLSSPDRRRLSTLLSDERNTEHNHFDALAAAQQEHERVRQAAIKAYELHELKEKESRILEAERIERDRLNTEAAIAAREKRVLELRAKSIPKPSPEPETPKAPEAVKIPEPIKPEARRTEVKNITQSFTPPSLSKSPTPAKPPPQNEPSQPQSKPALQNPFASVITKQVEQKPSSISLPPNGSNSTVQKAPTQPAKPVAVAPAASSQSAKGKQLERYTQIHQELKKLRKTLQAESKIAGSPLKGKLGTFRREIRVAIGQLTGGKGANAQPIAKITSILKEAREGAVPSPPIDASLFVAHLRQPVEGDPYQDSMIPSLFLYLLNICAKGIISQFINEAGANPKAADPVGVFAAHIFSHSNFHWRGKSLIDILIAKFRVVCPALFGLRGNDKTERGRINLGWKREGPAWITEQSHNDRMTGLGAGFASISLRDFSKTAKANPYPPTNYWTALAGIVNSPVGETSNTQYIILRSMIEGHERRFIQFYGNAAVAALRLALIEFPKKAPSNAPASGSLTALAELLKDDGLALA